MKTSINTLSICLFAALLLCSCSSNEPSVSPNEKFKEVIGEYSGRHYQRTFGEEPADCLDNISCKAKITVDDQFMIITLLDIYGEEYKSWKMDHSVISFNENSKAWTGEVVVDGVTYSMVYDINTTGLSFNGVKTGYTWYFLGSPGGDISTDYVPFNTVNNAAGSYSGSYTYCAFFGKNCTTKAVKAKLTMDSRGNITMTSDALPEIQFKYTYFGYNALSEGFLSNKACTTLSFYLDYHHKDRKATATITNIEGPSSVFNLKKD